MSKRAGWAVMGLGAVAIVVLALGTRGLAAEEEAPKAAPSGLGEELFHFGKAGIGPTQMTRVEAVAVDRDGFIYLGDSDLGRVQRFSPEGKLTVVAYVNRDRIDSLALERSGVLFVVAIRDLFRYDAKTLTYLGEVEQPHGEYLAVAPRPGGGVIAILEKDLTDEIAFLDKDGKVDHVFQGIIRKSVEYSVRNPVVAEDAKGNFYVADNGNNEILKFSKEGRFISRFGYEGHKAGDSQTEFSGLAIDSRGQLWAGSGWGNLGLVAPDGRPRGLYRMSAYGLAINDKDELYVTDLTQVHRYATSKP